MNFPIPQRLNAILTFSIMAIMSFHFYILVTFELSLFLLFLLSLSYGIFMNTGYALIHEAFHGVLNENKILNDLMGVCLCLFFPVPFHLIRQGHIGHHLRNRSDDEAFDFYFKEEFTPWKYMQYFGILTGFYWLTVCLSNFVVIILPTFLIKKFETLFSFDNPSKALFKSLNSTYGRIIFLEGVFNLTIHLSFLIILKVTFWKYFLLLYGFGLLWSAMQYVHHYDTSRDVIWGTRNLKTFYLLDKLWLNHNWHLSHHLFPTIPWIHLAKLKLPINPNRENMFWHCLKMWVGPSKTTMRVENKFKNDIIR